MEVRHVNILLICKHSKKKYIYLTVLPPAFTPETLVAAAAAANNVNSGNDDDFDDLSPPSPTPATLPIMNPDTIENSTILQKATDNNLLKQSLNLISSLQYHMNNNTFNKDDSIDDDDNDDNFDEPLLNENDLMFNLQPPTMVPAYLNYHYVCECGSRLLFLSIYWMKRIHIFKMLR